MVADISVVVYSKSSFAFTFAAKTRKGVFEFRITVVICILFSAANLVLCSCGWVFDIGIPVVVDELVFQCENGLDRVSVSHVGGARWVRHASWFARRINNWGE